MLYINKHRCLSCVLTATSSEPTNTCCMSTDTVVYPGTHVVYLETQHVSDVWQETELLICHRKNYIQGYSKDVTNQNLIFRTVVFFNTWTVFVFHSTRGGRNSINLKVCTAYQILFYVQIAIYLSIYQNSLFYPDCIGLHLLKI